MVEITINGEKHKIATDIPSTITYEEICELAGYSPKCHPSIICESPLRKAHIICSGEIGPVEVGAKYSVEYTGNA